MGCHNTRVIPAPVDAVWTALRNFHDMSWARGVIDKLEVVGPHKADQIGAKRILNGAFHETLLGLDEEERVVRYRIDDGPDPLAKDRMLNYIGQVRVFPVTDKEHAFVEWTSTWKGSDGAVKEFCDPIYVALLDALYKRFA
jgi:hypothetical protein